MIKRYSKFVLLVFMLVSVLFLTGCDKNYYRNEMLQLHRESDELKSECDTLKKESDKLRNQCDTLKNQCDTLRDQCDTLKKESDKMKQESDQLKEELETLKAKVGELETNLTSLQILVMAIKNREFVTSIIPIEKNGEIAGYTITFNRSRPIIFYNGKEGQEIGVKEDTDGKYYWTLDGDWLLDPNGNKIDASMSIPKFKADEDGWYISYDEGVTWKDAGFSRQKKLFDDVIVTDDDVTFVLSNGEELMIPRFSNISIEFDLDNQDVAVFPGHTIQVKYSLKNADENTLVTVSSNGAYVVRVKKISQSEGIIFIKCPHNFIDGYINVIVSDGRGYSFVKVISFYENRIEFPKGLEYHIPSHGGTFEIPNKVNFEYDVVVPDQFQNWLQIIPQSKVGMWNDQIELKVDANNTFDTRIGKVLIYPKASPDEVFKELTIIQGSAYFNISKSKLTAPVEGMQTKLKINTSLEPIIVMQKNVDWMKASLIHTGGDEYLMDVKVLPNTTSENREVKFDLYSSDPYVKMTTIEVYQLHSNEENYEDMIMVVRANIANDYTVYLPISGELDCYVDWGDGKVDKYESNVWNNGDYENRPHHTYPDDKPESYVVKVSGKVTAISSGHVKFSCVTDILQWGNTGLERLYGAFQNNHNLKTVSDKGCENWENVIDVSSMFNGCKSLQSIPKDLFISLSRVQSFNYTFADCFSLKQIPEGLFRNCKEVIDFSGCFSRCMMLKEIPENLFANCVKVHDFNYVFSNCKSLTSIPNNLFVNNKEIVSLSSAFSQCAKLSNIPKGLFQNCRLAERFDNIFSNCSALKTIPAELFKNCANATSFSDAFSGTILEYIPYNLFSGCRKVTEFNNTFGWIEELKGESPYDLIDGQKVHLYERQFYPDYYIIPAFYNNCFGGDYQLKDFESIPDDWKSW